MFNHFLRGAFISTILFLSIAAGQARTWREGLRDYVGESGNSMFYRYFLPENYDPTLKYPMVLFLHGSGESGNDNSKQVRATITSLINKTESDYPAILVVPQLPRSTGWSPNNPIDRTDEVLDSLFNSYSIDSERLYVTGFSMGGFGTMEYLQAFNFREPETRRFAAAAPLAGAFYDQSDPAVLDTLREIPIWLVHGDSDSTVSVETSRFTFRSIAGLEATEAIPFTETALGGPTAMIDDLRYTELPGAGHGIASSIYGKNQLYDWMFAQSLSNIIPEPTSAGMAFIAMILFSGRRKR